MSIDYGFGQVNIDPDTGIRYGVIPINDVLQAWADSSELDLPCNECDAYDPENDECSMGICEVNGLEYINDDQYVAYADSQGDIFIEASPYFTRADFCSPCAPGACHLRNPNINGAICYCFGHDWFEDNRAPYPVYSVKTGKLMKPEDCIPAHKQGWIVRNSYNPSEENSIRVDVAGEKFMLHAHEFNSNNIKSFLQQVISAAYSRSRR